MNAVQPERTIRAGSLAAVLLLVALGGNAQNQQPSPALQTNSPPEIVVHDAPPVPEKTGADKELEKAIGGRLESDAWVSSHNVNVSAISGAVTLQGKVDTVLARERAEALAKTFPGVNQVQNQIQVAVAGRADWDVISNIQNAYRRKPALKDSQIKAQSRNGSVTLSGIVGSNHRKHLAEALAKAVPGVATVENEIQVELLKPLSDNEVREDLLSRIAWDPWLENPHVAVEVRNGQAVLSGIVPNETARERLRKNSEMIGINSVDLAGVRVEPALVKEESPVEPGSLTPTGRTSTNMPPSPPE